MLRVFGIAIFLAAALLFLVQPMSGKVLLPLLGGSPSVWNTCMVFFQMALLLGYLYAHVLTTKVPAQWQGVVHVGLLVIAGVTLPAPIEVGEPGTADPRVWLLRTLLITVGLPFFVVSTSGPLLQKWFSRTDHPHARDPYFLYAASNAGSLIGLLAYPFVVEPLLTRWQQSVAWTGGFWILTPLVVGCAILAHRRAAPAPVKAAAAAPAAPVGWKRRVLWVLLAFAPSSLMLGVTQHISTDISAIPLLWVIPLSLYLVTFIVAFSNRVPISARGWGRLAAPVVLLLVFVMASLSRSPVLLVVTLHLLAFFVLAMMCHRRLAELRPDPAYLTEFYLWISVGGVLGGAFNALAAPQMFTTILEYPIAIGLACLLRPQAAEDDSSVKSAAWRWVLRGTAFVVGFGVFVAVLNIDAAAQVGVFTRGWFKGLQRHWPGGPPSDAVMIHVFRAGVPTLVVALLLMRRGAVRFAFAAGAVMCAAHMFANGRTLYRERTFFGTLDVSEDRFQNWHILSHGTTLHGIQAVRGNKTDLPTTYYHPTGPIGDVVGMLKEEGRLKHAGVIGLGVGSLAAYAEQGDTFDFFEIDKGVIEIANDPRFFTYIRDAGMRGARVRGYHGDGRLGMRGFITREESPESPETPFDLIVVDAFTSDAIPIHLVTKEAVAIYLSKLKPNGVIAFHISSRYFDLGPVLARIAEELGVVGRIRDDGDDKMTPELSAEAKRDSTWVVLGRTEGAFGALTAPPTDWVRLPDARGVEVWTDDFSNPLAAWAGN
ncbi:hypothetical protein PHYC_00997 [Phycisphaerales bacterium]|nr:hypothetical protein PHYC_00997 [Phycisphaerales bacterium]